MSIINKSTIGYSKLLQGKVNQDASFARKYKSATFLAVADGHGGLPFKYSADGARIATEVVHDVFSRIYEDHRGLKRLAKYINENRTTIKQMIHMYWVLWVIDDYKDNHNNGKFSEAQFEAFREYVKRLYLKQKQDEALSIDKIRTKAQYEEKMRVAIYHIIGNYGTTLSAAMITKKFVFALSIGDCDIIAYNNNEVCYLTPESEIYSNNTYSLCNGFDVVLDRIYTAFYSIRESRDEFDDNFFNPEMIMIASDGFKNSFVSKAMYNLKLEQVISLLKSGKGNIFKSKCLNWIKQLTKEGLFQDDISISMWTMYEM